MYEENQGLETNVVLNTLCLSHPKSNYVSSKFCSYFYDVNPLTQVKLSTIVSLQTNIKAESDHIFVVLTWSYRVSLFQQMAVVSFFLKIEQKVKRKLSF